jgi:His-Xaa-Ser system radical SAM maturase HxsC
MISLKTRGTPNGINNTLIAHIISDNNGLLSCYAPFEQQTIQLSSSFIDSSSLPFVHNIQDLMYLETGDIVLINPDGIINTLFRKNSPHNALFITDRCNSNCLMCSQPPKNEDDLDYLYDINSQLIQLIPDTTPELGITGGEPTILGNRFVELLQLLKDYLPDTEIHVLTNGRSFAWKNLPYKISEIRNRKVVFGVPLYSDYYLFHDYVVQAKNAFSQTMLGLHNLASYDQRIEIRVVLHQQTYKRLPSLARFIYMNLPFVEHVAFMGLEYTGYTLKYAELLWMEPGEYANELEQAVLFLDSMDINVSIYNLQLCLLKPTLWPFAKKSISDWKREYLNQCNICTKLNDCGGVFATSRKHSNKIMAILD